MRDLSNLAGILLLGSVVACGGSSAPANDTSSDAKSSAPSSKTVTSAASSDTEPSTLPKPKGPRGPIDPATVGSIHGVVRFEGDAPPRKPLAISGTGGCPEHATPPLGEEVIVENGMLANVFVYVKDGLSGWNVPPAKGEEVHLDQKGCIYAPHVLGLRVGQKLLVKNSDPTNHNVNIRSQRSEALNRVQPPNGQPVEWTPAKKELGVSFECNVHPWMRAWVCAVDDPWFAVTGADGAFTLQGLPPGDYVLEAWHEKYGKKTATVSVEPGGHGEVTIPFRASDKPH